MRASTRCTALRLGDILLLHAAQTVAQFSGFIFRRVSFLQGPFGL